MEENKAQPTKTKRKRRSKAEILKAKAQENLVPGNVNKNYMISKVQSEDCYVYAVKRVNYDAVLGQVEQGAEQIITYRQSSVHKAAIWEGGEIKINVRERMLRTEYGVKNVVLINDPYEEYE
jgi:hypothetical protein